MVPALLSMLILSSMLVNAYAEQIVMEQVTSDGKLDPVKVDG